MADGYIAEERPLKNEEVALLRWLLENGDLEAQRFLPQLGHARVISRCSCGCPSIDICIDNESLKATHQNRIVSDFYGTTADGTDVGTMVWAKDGMLSGLEVYCYGENTGPFGLPTIESLTEVPKVKR